MKRATLANFSQGNYVFMFQDGIDKLQDKVRANGNGAH